MPHRVEQSDLEEERRDQKMRDATGIVVNAITEKESYSLVELLLPLSTSFLTSGAIFDRTSLKMELQGGGEGRKCFESKSC